MQAIKAALIERQTNQFIYKHVVDSRTSDLFVFESVYLCMNVVDS